MAETRQIRLALGDIVKAYTASVPTIVTLSAPGGTGAVFGFSASIPPAGAADWIPVVFAPGFRHTFYMQPDDSLWVSLPAMPVGVPDVSIVCSPVI